MGRGCRITQQLRRPAAAPLVGQQPLRFLVERPERVGLPVRAAHRQPRGLETANLAHRLEPAAFGLQIEDGHLYRRRPHVPIAFAEPAPQGGRRLVFRSCGDRLLLLSPCRRRQGAHRHYHDHHHAAHHERPRVNCDLWRVILTFRGSPSQCRPHMPYHFPMRRRLVFAAIALALLVAVAGLSIVAQQAAPPPRRPGLVEPGITQLPNGWRIAPAGRHAQVGDLPLNMVWSPDGRYLLITNNGWAKPSITVFDTDQLLHPGDAADRSRVARAGLASGRQTALFVRRGAERDQRADLERRDAQGQRARS